MTYTTLISADELVQHLTDPEWAVVDCRFSLKDTERGRSDYQQDHIPGAVYAHLDEDLCGPIVPGRTGRHPLPEVEALAEKLSQWGIDSTVQVIAYDDTGGAIAAARLWWLLNWLGHPAVTVLDGGWPRWQRAGYNTRGGVEHRARRVFIPQPNDDLIVTAQQIAAALSDHSLRLFDARSADRYRGENETIDPIAGHIPGAGSAPYPDLLKPDGTFRSADEVRALYEPLLHQEPIEQTAFYCGSGVTAALNVLALKQAGLGTAKLYPGSWSEWITDPNRPIKTGSE